MSVTVEALLDMQELSGIKLVAGRAGLGNQIDLTNVMDTWDIHKWLTGNELVLSNGLMFASQPDQIAPMIRNLHAAGAAGLLVKLNRYIDRLPADAVAAADECGFPLMVSGEGLRFSEINRALNRQASKLPQSAQRYAAFAELLSKNAGVAAFLKLLDGYLGREAVYYDNLSAKRTSSRKASSAPEHGDGALADFLRANLCRSVEAGGNICGTLVVLGPKGSLPEDELSAITIDYAVSMLGMNQQKFLPSRFQDEYWKERFVSELLRGSSVVTDDEIRRRGRLCGYDFFAPTTVVVVEGADHLQETARRIAQRLADLERPAEGFLLFQLENYLVALWGGEGQRPQLGRWCREIAGRSRREGTPASVGIGGCVRAPKLLCESFREAQRAIQIGSRLSGNGVYWHDEMGMTNFLYTYAGTQEACSAVREVLGKLMDYDANKPSYALLPTLRAIVHCGFNLTSAADELYIHYNTLKYRYAKICEITGLDLSDFSNQAKVYFAFCLLRLRRDVEK